MVTVIFDRKGSRKYLNDLERQRLLAVLLAVPDPMRQAFGLTLFYTGCRISEALKLTVERVDIVGQALIFETLKRRKPGHYRSIPIPASLCQAISREINGRAPASRVFEFSRPTGYRLIKACMAQAGIAGVPSSPKGLRHGMAVACLAEDIPLTTVRKWMGHARLETTAIYLDVSGAEERSLAARLWAKGAA